MADEKMIDRAEHVLYKTYNRFPVVLTMERHNLVGYRRK